MTWPMILLAIGSVASGGLLAIGGTLEHWLEPVVGAHEAEHATPVWVATTVVLAVVAVGIAIAYRMYGTRPVPEEAPAGSALTVAARQDLYGDAFNERCSCGPVRSSPRGSGRDRRQGGRRRRERAGRAGRPHLGRIAAAANRLRPLVRAVDAGRCGAGGRGDPGGAAVVTSFPWLTVLWAVPMVGAGLVMLLPAAQRALAKWLALAISIGGARGDRGARGRLRARRRAVPVRRIPQVDTVIRHRLHPRRRRHRAALVVLTAVLVPLLIMAGWNDASDQIGWRAGRCTPTSR